MLQKLLSLVYRKNKEWGINCYYLLARIRKTKFMEIINSVIELSRTTVSINGTILIILIVLSARGIIK